MVWYLSAKEGKKKQKKIKMILKMMQSGNDDEANNTTTKQTTSAKQHAVFGVAAVSLKFPEIWFCWHHMPYCIDILIKIPVV